jgi:hypothetical protein
MHGLHGAQSQCQVNMTKALSLSAGTSRKCYIITIFNLTEPLLVAATKQMHQSVNCLQVLCQWNSPVGLENAHALVDTALANSMYTKCARFHSSIKTTPGAMEFLCSMVMKILLLSNLMLLQQNQQHLIDQHLIESNCQCLIIN